MGEEVRWGRAQLRDLAPVTEFAIADSEFNERELQAAGYRSTDHRAPAHRSGGFHRARPTPPWPLGWPRQKAGGGADLLFVGKVSPHKGQDDLVKALAAYRRLYDPEARLHIVGGAISEEYQQAVERFADELDLADAVEFAGSVTHEELIAYYDGSRRVPAASPTTRGSAFPCSSRCTTDCPSWPTATPRSPRRSGGRSGPPRQGAGPGGGRHRSGGPATTGSAQMLAAAAAERVDAFALPRVQDGFVAALEAACAA